MTALTEGDVEHAVLDWLSGLGWDLAHGPDIAPDTPNAEREDYGQVVLERRLQDALAELNPSLPAEALDDAYRKLTCPEEDLEPGRAADRLTGGGLRRRAGHLRRCGTGQAGYLGALRRIPG